MDIPQGESSDAGNAPLKDMQKPPPLRSLLTRPVLITIANYAMFAFLDMSALVLIPLIWSTPVEFRGLNLSPASIGLWMSVYGCMDGILQFTVFPRAVGCCGLRGVFVVSIAASAVVFAMFPVENNVQRQAFGSPNILWLLIFLQLLSLSIHRMGLGKSLRLF